MDDLERVYWNLLARMGYSTSPRGINYGSVKHREYEELQNLFELEKMAVNGNLGWPAAMFYSKYRNRYREAHILFTLLSKKNSDVIELVEIELKRDLKYLEGTVELYLKEIREMKEWVLRGGLVDEEVIVDKLNVRDEGYEGILGYLREYLDEAFGEVYRERLKILVSEFDGNLKKLCTTFDLHRRKAERKVEELRGEVETLCRLAHLDPETTIMKLQ